MRTVFSIFIALGLIVALILVFASPAHAQDLQELENLPARVQKQIKSGEYPYPFRETGWVSEQQITLHLRGKEGSPLQIKPQKTPVADPQQLQKDKAVAAMLSEEMLASHKRISQGYDSLPPLPPCGKDSSTFERFEKSSGGGSKLDILFINPEQMPTDPKEVFGKGTHIVPYDRKLKPKSAFLTRVLHVRCLPSRQRILGDGISKLEGVPALKNYDGDLYGAGTLHPAMRTKVQGLLDEGGNSL